MVSDPAVSRATRRRRARRLLGGALVASLVFAACAAPAQPSGNPYAKWSRGPRKDAGYFPIAVWLQRPQNAKRYQALGVNLYVGLWQGPTAAQLRELKQAGLPVVCEQNQVGLSDPNNDIIVGWMHGDEPDNAQSLGRGKGYGPPIPAAQIVADYQRIAAADPTRPVFLDLGQGVAWDGWIGRGVRTNHPEDYPGYVAGCDIASFDIYPVTHHRAEVAGKLEYVPHGVRRLRQWGQDQRLVWNAIECTHIDNARLKPTPAQVRSEVWMSLIAGSQGIIYFCHQFAPRFIEAGLLADAEMCTAIQQLNAQIRELAPVLNSPSLPDAVSVSSSDPTVPVKVLAKRDAQAGYVFAAAERNARTTATFTCRQPGATRAVVLGEDRSVPLKDGAFSDEFGPYGVHLYRLE